MMHNYFSCNRLSSFLLVLFFSTISSGLFAQDRCGTVEVRENLRKKTWLRETDDQFEEWISKRKSSKSGRIDASGVYTIPVVVHVIHKGEAVGSGVNISDAQIISQIKVLNDDFNRTNQDAANTPAEFQAVAGSLNIKFVLATQTPDKLPTNGIVRVKGSKSQWTINDERTLKATSYWPAEDYLNIWVTDLSSTLLGYAQFPVSDLPGLESATNNRLTDGVVVDYAVVGSRNDGAFNLTSSFNQGRTATHEVGHFFGLRHIWGDDNGSCSGNGDYVSDTPNQGNNTSGCPSHPLTSCSAHTMFQNYMDYTNDVCMNLFTQGQVERMVTVLENSPRRSSLLNSQGAADLSPKENDLALTALVSPSAHVCTGTVVPELQVRNNGTNTIYSTTIKLSLSGVVIEEKEFVFTPGLAPSASQQIAFSEVSLPAGTSSFQLQVESTNNGADGRMEDNALSVTAYAPYAAALPFIERFSGMPSTWSTSTGQAVTWQVQTAPKDHAVNQAVYLDLYNSSATGLTNALLTPAFDLTQSPHPFLAFDVAYAHRKNDGLKIYVITDCSGDVANGTEVYARYGSDLSTNSSATAFTPAGEQDWRKEIIDLSAFTKHSNVQLAFVGVNDGGNAIYLDNIAVVKAITENVSLVSVIKPTPVQCNDRVAPAVVVKNVGNVTVNSVAIRYRLNEGETHIARSGNLDLAAGQEMAITLPQLALMPGRNSIFIELTEPNELNDTDPADNRVEFYTVLNQSADRIPLREDFNGATVAETWTMISPGSDAGFSLTSTNYEQSVFYKASGQDNEAWLVSASLDLKNVSRASVFFDLAYAKSTTNVAQANPAKAIVNDQLTVLVSTDCGESYPYVVFDEVLEGLTAGNKSLNGVPSSHADWSRKFIDLSEFAGEANVRLAFVFSSAGSNNLYLDNIEFFESDNPTTFPGEKPVVVYGTDPSGTPDFYVTFNLAARQPVAYALVDMQGRTLQREVLNDVLNQTVKVTPAVRAGIYLFRVQIGQKFYTTKVYLQ